MVTGRRTESRPDCCSTELTIFSTCSQRRRPALSAPSASASPIRPPLRSIASNLVAAVQQCSCPPPEPTPTAFVHATFQPSRPPTPRDYCKDEQLRIRLRPLHSLGIGSGSCSWWGSGQQQDGEHSLLPTWPLVTPTPHVRPHADPRCCIHPPSPLRFALRWRLRRPTSKPKSTRRSALCATISRRSTSVERI